MGTLKGALSRGAKKEAETGIKALERGFVLAKEQLGARETSTSPWLPHRPAAKEEQVSNHKGRGGVPFSHLPLRDLERQPRLAEGEAVS